MDPRTGSSTGPGCSVGCFVTLAIWSSRPNESSHKCQQQLGCYLEPLTGCHRWTTAEILGFCIKAQPSSANYSSFENQLLACHWALVETEHLIMATKLPWDLRYPAWAGFYLTYNPSNWMYNNSNPSTNGNGIHMVRPYWVPNKLYKDVAQMCSSLFLV